MHCITSKKEKKSTVTSGTHLAIYYSNVCSGYVIYRLLKVNNSGGGNYTLPELAYRY